MTGDARGLFGEHGDVGVNDACSASYCRTVLTLFFFFLFSPPSQMIPFAIACLGEAVGYGFRRVSADHPTGRHAGLTWVRCRLLPSLLFPSKLTFFDRCKQYILQELFIILCPALMAASYYMCFGRTSLLPSLPSSSP